MQDKINKDFICTLKDNADTTQIEIEYVPIVNPFEDILQELKNMCTSTDTRLSDIFRYLKATPEYDKLDASYKYCEFLRGSYQGFSVNNQDEINTLIRRAKLIGINYKNNPKEFDLNGAINEIKSDILEQYTLWCHAYSINKTYRKCHDDPKVLTFSHRICGWSNPLYKLTTNFSVEIMTNFGYGPVSYFYTKFTYKNIEVTPVSDWIAYEKAEFADIIRYSKKHELEHDKWFEAMEYARVACNISRSNEEEFVSKYIIDECERMVHGLERAMTISQFQFRDQRQKEYTKNKEGHVLIEFRGEKISGALDFINKILEFKNITSVSDFIERIKACNRTIQPILANEIIILDTKISQLEIEIKIYKPKHDEIYQKHQEYGAKKEELKIELISKNLMTWHNINLDIWNKSFAKLYPEYEEFKTEFDKVRDNWIMMNERHKNLVMCRKKIVEYSDKIIEFFD